MALTGGVARSFAGQARACRRLGSEFTAAVIEALAADMPDSAFAFRIANWSGDPVADGLPLRAAGALHAMALCAEGEDGGFDKDAASALAAVYPPGAPGSEALGAALSKAIKAEDARLKDWLSSPPQTNEVGRSAVLLGGLLTMARILGTPVELAEIGASAGLNLGLDGYRFELGENLRWGAPDAPIHIASDWTGKSPPLNAPLEISTRRGVDLSPLDPSDPKHRLRLTAYVWPDQPARLSRLRAALTQAAAQPWRVEQGDAADWVEGWLTAPAQGGRVLMHSVMWRYMPAETQDRVARAMEMAGGTASPEQPLAWLAMEMDGSSRSAAVKLRIWRGRGDDGETRALGRCHFHGAWADWSS